MSSFFENLKTAGEQAFGDFANKALDSGLASLGFVVVAPPDKGNLSQAQISAGQRGSYDTVVDQRVSMDAPKNSLGFPMMNNPWLVGGLVVGGVALLAWLLRKRR